MRLTTHPHCGRVFICDETLGITDFREALDAFGHVFEYGTHQASGHSRAWNMGGLTGQGTLGLFDDPLCGIVGSSTTGGANIDFFPATNSPFVWRHVIELVDNEDAAAVTVGFRFLTREEYANIDPNPNPNAANYGIGADSQRIRIEYRNVDSGAAYTVLDIFANRGGYGTLVGLAATSTKWLDVETGAAQPNAIGGVLNPAGVNVITLLDSIPANLRQSNRGCAGVLILTYEMARNPTGGNWTGAARDADFLSAEHPLSGVGYAAAGILECEMITYRSGAWTTGNASNTVNSRIISAVPSIATNPPQMGALLDTNINSLNTYATAAKQVGWPGFKAAGNNRGGINRPLVGDSFNFFEVGGQSMTTSGEIPHGATQWVLIAYLKTTNNAGGQTLTFRIQKDTTTGSAIQTIATTSFASSGSNGARYFRLAGALSAAMLPVSGQVERLTCIVESSKPFPRGAVSEPYHYWDGVFSMILKFF